MHTLAVFVKKTCLLCSDFFSRQIARAFVFVLMMTPVIWRIFSLTIFRSKLKARMKTAIHLACLSMWIWTSLIAKTKPRSMCLSLKMAKPPNASRISVGIYQNSKKRTVYTSEIFCSQKCPPKSKFKMSTPSPRCLMPNWSPKPCWRVVSGCLPWTKSTSPLIKSIPITA